MFSCKCDYVKPIWDNLVKIIKDKNDTDLEKFIRGPN